MWRNSFYLSGLWIGSSKGTKNLLLGVDGNGWLISETSAHSVGHSRTIPWRGITIRYLCSIMVWSFKYIYHRSCQSTTRIPISSNSTQKLKRKKIHSRNNFFLLSSNGQDIIRRCRFLRRRVKSGCANEHGVRVRAWVCVRECVSACMGAGARVCECDREEERPRE